MLAYFRSQLIFRLEIIIRLDLMTRNVYFVSQVIAKLEVAIDKKLIIMRKDRQIHVDVGTQLLYFLNY
jgi:hypothetical protein